MYNFCNWPQIPDSINIGGVGGSSMLDDMKFVMLGGMVETARRVSTSARSAPLPSFSYIHFLMTII